MFFRNLWKSSANRMMVEPENKFSSKSAWLALITFVAFVAFGFISSIHYSEKIFFILSFGLGITFALVVFGISQLLSEKFANRAGGDNLVAKLDPFIQKISTAGFDAAVSHSFALVRLIRNLPSNCEPMPTIVEQSLFFYLKSLCMIAKARDATGGNFELRQQFSKLQDSLENHMRQTQKGVVSPASAQNLDNQVSTIQSRLDQIETLHRLALQITMDLSQLRFSCEAASQNSSIPVEFQAQCTRVAHEQLLREKRLRPELLRLGLI